MIMSTEFLSLEGVVAERWGGSTQVLTMGQSMFVAGTAVSPRPRFRLFKIEV